MTMEHLRALFEELGYGSVETFIASGNVIFDAATTDAEALEREIERHLRQSLGYEVTTFLRSAPELAAVASYQPFEAVADGTLYVAFLPDVPAAEAQNRLLACRSEIDDFHVYGREVYWLCRTSMSASTFSGNVLERVLGMPATLRNATTLRKLAAKYEAR